MNRFNSFLKLIILFISLTLTFNTAIAGYNKNLWPIWEINNPLSTKTISHDDWQTFLTRRVTINEEGIHLVDYSQFTDSDRDLLKGYINKMGRIKIQNYNRNEQLAFWINLYNAVIIQTISNYYPVGSIEDINISPGLFSMGPWGAKLVTVNGTPLSLDEIQNRIIRPIWNDARIHYAINNGSIGGANLQKYAYQGKILETQLNEGASRYINSFRGAQVIEGKLIVSKIFEWFNEDFGGTKSDIIIHLQQFSNEPLRSQLKHINTIDNYVYNWHLNNTIEKNRE